MGRLGVVQMRIRPATTHDLPAMVAIKHDAGVAAWPHILPLEVIETLPFLDRWSAAIDASDPQVHVLVAESNARVIGFAVTRPSGDTDADAAIGELDGFYVDPAAWGIGAGRAEQRSCGSWICTSVIACAARSIVRSTRPNARPYECDSMIAIPCTTWATAW